MVSMMFSFWSKVSIISGGLSSRASKLQVCQCHKEEIGALNRLGGLDSEKPKEYFWKNYLCPVTIYGVPLFNQ